MSSNTNSGVLETRKSLEQGKGLIGSNRSNIVVGVVGDICFSFFSPFVFVLNPKFVLSGICRFFRSKRRFLVPLHVKEGDGV